MINKPAKPSISETISWLWRSKLVQRYQSERDAEMYDLVARYYFGRQELAKQISLEFLKRIEVVPTEAMICDRAAGTGIITEALLDVGYNVCASDLSQTQLKTLAEKFSVATTKIEDLNGQMIGVEDNSIDGIVEVGADRFMTPMGQELFVQEAARTLKVGGILIWPTFPSEYHAKFTQGWRWRASSLAKIKLLKKNGFIILSNRLHIKSFSLAAVCRILVARK